VPKTVTSGKEEFPFSTFSNFFLLFQMKKEKKNGKSNEKVRKKNIKISFFSFSEIGRKRMPKTSH
jgi:hypothetical protein